MGIKSNIRKILVISFWCFISAGVLVLLIAAMKVKQEKICTGYNIEIIRSPDQLFLDKEDIARLLVSSPGYSLAGQSLKTFDLRKMEEKLERNEWISVAELFFDNKQTLQVRVEEREPVARVFTVSGNSFYVDSTGKRLGLSTKFSARVPVFTGFPTNKIAKADSLLLNTIHRMSRYILANEFWMAQVAQIDINASGNFEIVPALGNHIIEFGDGKNFDEKFARLLVFYKQVISKSGFNVYDRIKVQYTDQIVGVRNAAAMSRYDSLQAIKNVERLIAEARTEQERLIRMDSVEMTRMQHRTDNGGSPALLAMPDSSLTEKPNIQQQRNKSLEKEPKRKVQL
ncbi:MAG: hypothetical protein H7Y31_11105 [Chitinophagaceae bacterium]|nr:hypothetical protein [Chitinophagaceae bacterium]